MNDHTTTPPRGAMGLDVSDQYTQVCAVDEQGEIVEEGRVRTTPEAFRGRFAGSEPARIALEAGTHSRWISQLLRESGHEVLIANPRKLRMIYQSDSKDDRMDARMLARVARFDPELLAPIQHREQDQQVHLEMLRARDLLVRTRTALVNHVRSVVKSFGAKLPTCSAESFPQKVADHIPAELGPVLSPLLDTLGHLSARIRDYEKQMEALVKEEYPESALLAQIKGVGSLTALAYILTIHDPYRFSKSRTLGAYLGLRPRRDDSGERKSQLPITKAGDGFLRRLLVGSAQYILGPFGQDCDLRRWGLAKAQSGGKAAKKRAVVAVARKLAVLLHRLWVTGEVYQPLRKQTVSADKEVVA